MPKSSDDDVRRVSRRMLLRGIGAVVPGLVLAAAVDSVAVAGASAAVAGAAGTVRGTFSASGYSWPALLPTESAAAAVSGVVFALTADGRPAAGRRVRFCISDFHAVGRSVWFETATGAKSVDRLGYLDLDTDPSGTVALGPWLRRGGVSTAATAARPVLRAQLVGSETILASARLSVI